MIFANALSTSFCVPSWYATHFEVYGREMVFVNISHQRQVPSTRQYPQMYSCPFIVNFIFCASSLSTSMNNGDWLNTFTSLFNLATLKSMLNSQVIRGNRLEHNNYGSNVPSKLSFPSMEYILHFQCMQSILPIILGNPLSFLAKIGLRQSTVGRQLQSSPKHKMAPLHKCLGHYKTKLFPILYTHQWSQQYYRRRAWGGQQCIFWWKERLWWLTASVLRVKQGNAYPSSLKLEEKDSSTCDALNVEPYIEGHHLGLVDMSKICLETMVCIQLMMWMQWSSG